MQFQKLYILFTRKQDKYDTIDVGILAKGEVAE